MIAIADLVTTWSSNSNDGYRSSASFLGASAAQLLARMHETYGASLQALETEWRRALE